MDTPEIAAAKIRTAEEIGTIHMVGDFVRAPRLARNIVKSKGRGAKGACSIYALLPQSMVQVHRLRYR